MQKLSSLLFYVTPQVKNDLLAVIYGSCVYKGLIYRSRYIISSLYIEENSKSNT